MLSADEFEVFRTYASDGAIALQSLEECLLVLEGAPREMEEINRLYRALHTLKGNSALLGLLQIERVSHAAEDMVGVVRDQGVQFGRDLVELMLRFKDRVGECMARVAEAQCDAAEGTFDDLIGDITRWRLEHGGIAPQPQGVDRGAFMIFASDAPPAGQKDAEPELGGPDTLALELLLGATRELLVALTEGGRSGESGLAFEASEALRLSCLHQHELALASAAAHIGEQLARVPGDRQGMQRALTDMRSVAASLVARRLEMTGFPDEFGLDELCAALLAEYNAPPSVQPAVAEPAAAVSTPNERLRPPAPGRERVAATPERSPPDHAATPKAGPRHDGGDAKADYLRIDARKVSLLMELAGEIALACGAVTHHPGLPSEMPEGFVNASQKLELLIRELQNEVSAMRLVSVSGVFQRMKRVVRDTSQRTGKKVELELLGEDTEIDKVMVDALNDPLVHLVRNAIDHGIESPAERVAAGKPETGRLVIEAMHQGGEVSVQVRDDGRGMSRQRIRARAEQRGLVSPQATLSDAELLELVFLPGFSTKDTIDEVSGRGVGMDVIRTSVQSLRGQVQIESREGHGSQVNLTLPLTLAFVEAMVVRERDRLFALPIEKVLEVFKPEPNRLIASSSDGSMSLRLRERLIPVLWLHRYFGDGNAVDERLDDRVIVVTQTGSGVVAIPVHALLGNQPIMLKPLRGVLAGVRAAAGCGMLRTGDIALALDTEGLRA